MPPPDWKSAVEIHPPGWIIPAERFWIAGSVTSATGLTPVDVRAWLGGQPFLGLCGLPRAGFSFLLDPVPGATELRIEVCDRTGRWTEIFRQAVTCPGHATAPVPPPDASPLLRLLQARHVRPDEAWSALAREILAAGAATPFDVEPSPPFHGALEQLNARAAVQYDHLLVTGWMAHREQRITGLTALLDTATPLPLVHGLSRPDTVTLFPDLIDGARSRFAGWLPIPARLPRPLALRIFADLADGRRELVFVRRFSPVLVSGAGTDLPPFSLWKFACAARAMRAAGWGATWTGEIFRSVLRAAWQEYRAAAPTTRLPRSAPPDQVTAATRPLQVTLVTHNLNREGAPLFLLEYARHLAAQPGWTVNLVSPQDGPLRADFTAAGVPVRVIDAATLDAAGSEEEFAAALDQAAVAANWTAADVIVANTMVTYWAVHLAHRLRKPSILYVHESVSARRFFAPQLARPAVARVERAFALATRVAFPAAAGQLAHAALAGRGNFRVLPGWIDVARIQAYAAAHPRAAVRAALGYPADAIIVANIGSVLPRKGQHVFLEAVARLPARAPTPPLIFLLVGAKAGPDPYTDLLRHTIATRPLPHVRLIEQAADPYQYFQAANLCVCSSLEEVFPRVVLEAAAFGRPIVSTDVNGIPEMLGPGDAWLVPPDDAARLADALQAALDALSRADTTRATRARAMVTTRFDAAVLLPRHADLVRTVAAIPPH